MEQRRSQKRKNQSQRKKIKVREKVEKSRNHAKPCETLCFFRCCGSGGSKSKLAKAAGAEPSGRRRDQKLDVLVARSTSQSENAN